MRPNPWPLLRRLARQPTGESDPVSDAELLARFARDQDQAAFELLVWRHGPMVFGACRRILRDVHLAEDAFQAAFLILARKADSIRAGGSLAGWLHRVARRAAVRAAKRHRRIEPLTVDLPGRSSPTPDANLRAILDAEIDRLPDRFRLPVVLCYLDGRTTEDAARLLGIPRGTVLSRLATARQRLAARLTRRGIAMPATLAAVAGSGVEVISTEAVAACVSTAIRFASGLAVPGASVQLAEGVLRMGFRKATAAWAAVMLSATGVGTGIAVMADDPKPRAGAAPVAATPTQPNKPPRGPTPADKDRAEQDRRRELAGTIDQLLKEREKLYALAEEYQQVIIRKQREELNPQVIHALGAVLTEAELTIFRTELEVPSAEQRVEDHRNRLKEAEAKLISPLQIARVSTPELEKLLTLEKTHAQLSRELAKLSTTKEDTPAVRELVAKLGQLATEIKHARTAAHEAAKKAIRDDLLAPIQRQLAEAEADLRRNQRTIEAARKRRDEIVATLAKADDRNQSVEIQRLTTELQANREMARQLSRLAMELELKLKGLPVPDPPRTSAADDKLDRVLRELADLRAEVRQLRERK
ncbi:MAG TPA: sigma-70 family RNA polymerase sigma factor [Fimbriiglobus sp.]|nr:sigma-70 family RNA polymerase sigma factor [Fimbriiglobus sp.]